MFPHKLNIPPMSYLKDLIKESVIGQEKVINIIATSIYRHLIKISANNRGLLNQYQSNLLVLGKTGTGKTFITKKIAGILNLPFIEINAMDISRGGTWKGDTLLDILTTKFRDIENTESRNYPIIFIDEFDKMCKEDSQNSSAAVQAAILKVIEGMQVEINLVKYDTRNFYFIFAGAFTDIINDKISHQNIGFTNNEPYESSIDITAQLETAGVLPELCGRITRIIRTDDFSKEMYYKLLFNKNTFFNQWINYLKNIIKIDIKEWNAPYLVKEAEKRNLGARGLIQLVEIELDAIIMENINKIDVNKEWSKQFPSNKLSNEEDLL